MNIKLLVIILIASILLVIGTVYGYNSYGEYRCQKIVEQTKIELAQLKTNVSFTKATVDRTSFILVSSEKAELVLSIDNVMETLPSIEETFNKYATLKDTKLVRSKLEPKFDESYKDGYKTPLERIVELNKKLNVVTEYCSNRDKIRNRVVYNEMLLKAILKKPTSGVELGKDLEKIQKYVPNLLSIIPRDTEDNRSRIASLNDANLINSMGIKLWSYISIVNEIKSIARAQDIGVKAQEMWDSAKKSYSNVKTFNNYIHWYSPPNDDGTYDLEAYTRLLETQAKALSWYEAGNSFLDRLSNYRNEIKSQKLSYVSSNHSEETSFRHSRSVAVTKTRHNNGKTETYTSSETRYYNTPGYKFYYTITTITNGVPSIQTIYVGSKDSKHYYNSFGGWKTWDYLPNQTQGYLGEYKPYGFDNRSIVVGGYYNPAIHTLR
jgi:hypothetical protein